MGTIDDYLADLAAADRDAIDRVYALARQEAPDAEQGKGYGMPALVHRGKPLISVMRAKTHIGIYPFSPDAVAAVAEALDGQPGVSVDKGTVRFQPEHPIPSDVVKRLVRVRLAQIDGP